MIFIISLLEIYIQVLVIYYKIGGTRIKIYTKLNTFQFINIFIDINYSYNNIKSISRLINKSCIQKTRRNKKKTN